MVFPVLDGFVLLSAERAAALVAIVVVVASYYPDRGRGAGLDAPFLHHGWPPVSRIDPPWAGSDGKTIRTGAILLTGVGRSTLKRPLRRGKLLSSVQL